MPRGLRAIEALRAALTVVAAAAAMEATAAERAYVEATHGPASLKYHGDMPVLSVVGSPAAIGEQMGALAKPALERLQGQADAIVDAWGVRVVWPLMLKTANLAVKRFPPDHLAEIEAMSAAAGVERELFIAGHVMPDVLRMRGCSDIVVEPARSATGRLIFGRNTDTPPLADFNRYWLAVIFRPQGKHAFVSLGMPGMVGASAAMNDAGLCLGQNSIYAAADESPAFDPSGSPTILNTRRILEECATVDEAEELVREMKWCAATLICVADREQGRVFEITPRTVRTRDAQAGFCAATNELRTDDLCVTRDCWRMSRLAELTAAGREISPDGVADLLDRVNQGEYTATSAIFEPASLRAHVVAGPGPVTRLPRTILDGEILFKASP